MNGEWLMAIVRKTTDCVRYVMDRCDDYAEMAGIVAAFMTVLREHGSLGLAVGTYNNHAPADERLVWHGEAFWENGERFRRLMEQRDSLEDENTVLRAAVNELTAKVEALEKGREEKR